jgi:type I restriction enzyme R subunit
MLEHVNFDEARQSQLPFIELLLNLGYKYLPAAEVLRERGDDPYNFILADIAAKKLMEINSYEIDGIEYKFSEKDVREAIYELEHWPYEGLIESSQKIFNMIMPSNGGKTIVVNHNGKKVSKNFRFIDFTNIENNDFHVTAEYVASGKQNIRPDIVCFVNGIPFVVVENKKSSVSVNEALSQMNRNQGTDYCPKLYTYAQLLIGTNGKDLRYGAAGTPNKFYAVWKEKELSPEDFDDKVISVMQRQIHDGEYHKILKDLNGDVLNHVQYTGRMVTEQDRGVVSLLEPKRLLDLTKNYTLFDAGVRKLSRYQQYFAIHKMLKRVEEEEILDGGIERRKGGLLWHTQGSGKSLTMVMFVKALIEDPAIVNPRVIIVTDRRDLDKQIKDTFKNCNLKKTVIQASSGQHLLDLIKEKNLAVITTLIHKFEPARKKNVDFVDDDRNIFVLIDEAHRSQNGIANFEMNKIIPNACYIGFTGTPLMKNEKESWRKFGGYIDKYTIDDALTDKIILPLIYEGRYVELEQNAEQIDRHSERITANLSEKEKKILQKYINGKAIANNPQRIAEIAFDIEKHFLENFKDTGLKGQIVAPSKYSAVLFQRYFEGQGNINTAMVISDEHEDIGTVDIHKKEVVSYLNKIKEKHASVEKYEKSVIDSFKHNDDGIEIIIVVDKLLTGFDAPRNTVLYLTKDLRDHNLLQAIARVNRLFENKKEKPKTAGYIIDYSENAKNIDTAMKLFGNYDESDVQGTLIDVDDKIRDLEKEYSILHDIFKTLNNSNDDEVYLQYLDDEARRQTFYKSLSSFIKTFSDCFVLRDFVHKFKDLDLYQKELKKFVELRKASSLRYADTVDLLEYKQSLVNILDKYVDAKGVELLTKPVNITDRENFDNALNGLGSDKSKAEAIAAQVEKTITEKMDTDPEFYEKFSRKISEILEKMKQGKMEDVKVLEQMKLIRDDVLNKKDDQLPQKIHDNPGADIFYRNLKAVFDEFELDDALFLNIVLDIFKIIKHNAIVDWYKNIDVKRKMMNTLDDYLYDVVRGERKIELSGQDIKNILDKVMQLAENNYSIFI